MERLNSLCLAVILFYLDSDTNSTTMDTLIRKCNLPALFQFSSYEGVRGGAVSLVRKGGLYLKSLITQRFLSN